MFRTVHQGNKGVTTARGSNNSQGEVTTARGEVTTARGEVTTARGEVTTARGR